MGLLDGLAGQVLGSLAKSSGSGQGGVLEAVSGLIANHPGGLGGLVSEFERGGLGGVVASWVGTGANLPITAEQLQSVLGSDKLQSVAAALGVSPEEASSKVAELLPQIVDKLTPAGAVPEQSALGSLLGALKG